MGKSCGKLSVICVIFVTTLKYRTMKIISVDSTVVKLLFEKLNFIENYIKEYIPNENEDEMWVDNYEVCTFLHISDRTLQRLRQGGLIEYSLIKGKAYYKIGEIKRMLNEKLIKRDLSHIQNLIENHKQYVKQRKNLRKDQ